MNSPGVLPLFAGTGAFGLALVLSLATGLTLGGLNFARLVERKTQPALYWSLLAVYAAMFGLLAWFSAMVIAGG